MNQEDQRSTWERKLDLEVAERVYFGLIDDEGPLPPKTTPEEPEHLKDCPFWGK